MVACLFLCHVSLVDNMNRLSSVTGILPCLCSCSKLSREANNKLVGFGFSFQLQRKKNLKFVVSAELSRAFSNNFDLDSQIVQSHDQSQLPWIGPVPGDIAELEAYCRIFRTAERLHAALMDTLCNPITGECSVSYDFTAEEKPILEDKIVSVLGCMLSLLNKGREDVLSGRYSLMNSFPATDGLSGRYSLMNSFPVMDVSMMDDKLPPLAIFRSEMKRCCESLHVALENYLTSDDDRSLAVWRKLQRLKNVCYDSGFPRHDDYPCHTLFANWSPVYLFTSKEDVASKNSEVAFWKGGQVTDEGLNWLLNKGFKTIIDLREETIKDNFYQEAVDIAILSGKLELIKIPVEARTAPSVDQVVKFASLVSDCSKKPIYLHSKEGAWRTSAMISRWRQYMTRSASQLIVSSESSDMVLQETDETRDIQASSINKRSLLEQTNGSLELALDKVRGSNGVSHDVVSPLKEERGQSNDGVYNAPVSSVSGTTSLETVDSEEGSSANFCREIDPLGAQSPPSNIFSKADMSRFFKTKRISPPSYSKYKLSKFKKPPVSKDKYTGMVQASEIVDIVPKSLLTEGKKSNGSASDENISPKFKSSSLDGQKHLKSGSFTSVPSVSNAFGEVDRNYVPKTNASGSLNQHVKSANVREARAGSGAASLSLRDDELGTIEGDMCASATGVVRLQSRRKAEMFLVRTDGFSCTREKVTESSLAFTHPSTQQQMLMWKTTPKTVLLLKKLGQELMEEAKEVASFLYHQEKMNVIVEPDVHDIFARIPGFGFVQTFYSQDTSDLHERIDFVACLGGDGVILHASNLFRDAVPPVVSFNLGSLGFLTSHSFEEYKQDLRQVIHGNSTVDGVYITLRMRLRCEIFRNGKAVPGKVFDVLNEMVVDRGSNPYLSKIECYEHDRLITKVQGDGIIVATPTGSTAYSTAAGGSMVHPNVPCMLFTPICPHSLSFRPVILPDSARLELKIPDDARSNAWVSFDGKRRQQLSRGHSIRISMSQHPLPTVNKCDQTGDWFRSLIRCLNWNERLDQKAL
ncbi:NAD kinase 2, chloroplastic [Mercurialis annua]|uniref:NAD kinase 2, chloroplastic n=1 Tax=Mercurialis annua TaxID=3986 RepID=UPI00215F6284|nr:NAD kinase 2, chloroplastic [Mercurialis annua]